MKTIFGRKSLLAIENPEAVGGADEWRWLYSNEGLSRDRRHLRGRSKPRRAAHHGSSLDGGRSSRETKTLQSSRYLPDDGASVEFADDRTRDVAVVPATREAGVV